MLNGFPPWSTWHKFPTPTNQPRIHVACTLHLHFIFLRRSMHSNLAIRISAYNTSPTEGHWRWRHFTAAQYIHARRICSSLYLVLRATPSVDNLWKAYVFVLQLILKSTDAWRSCPSLFYIPCDLLCFVCFNSSSAARVGSCRSTMAGDELLAKIEQLTQKCKLTS